MKELENESKKDRLARIVRNEIIPKLQLTTGLLTEEYIELIIDKVRIKSVIKDQCFQEEGSYEDGQLHYIYSGIACSYYDHAGINKLSINRICKKTEVLFDIPSFVTDIDRDESFHMKEGGEIISLDYYSLKTIFEQFPEMYRALLFIGADRQKHFNFYTHLLKLPVDERVKQYLERNPTLMARINRDCIASYLNISRCRLSTAYALYMQRQKKS